MTGGGGAEEDGAAEVAAATLATPAMLMALWLMTEVNAFLLDRTLVDAGSSVLTSRRPTPSTPAAQRKIQNNFA